MSESFDPYRVWLGIPPESRPPTHYELLGISPKETENEVFKAAVTRQSAYVRNFQIGKHATDASRILNEIAAAKVCLLDPVKRAKYDAELKAKHSAINSPALAPAIDLDQLAASTASTPRSPVAGGARGRPPRLVTSAKRRKQSALFWQIPVAIGASVAIAGLAFVILRPGSGKLPSDRSSRSVTPGADVADADVAPNTVAAAGTSQPVTVNGNVLPASVPAPDLVEDEPKAPDDVAAAPKPNKSEPTNKSPDPARTPESGEPRDRSKGWTYGYGSLDPGASGLTEFTLFPYFNGSAWQGSAERPDPTVDWALLNAVGGHPGRHHAVVRRWTSPVDGVVAVVGTLTHTDPAVVSDGIRGRVIAERTGTKGEWSVRDGTVATEIKTFTVASGEHVDFIVDCLMHESFDAFDWPVTLKLKRGSGEIASIWDSVADFAGAKPTTQSGGFADFQGHWDIHFPAPYEHLLAIDAEGNVDFSGFPNISWRARLRKDGDAVLLLRNDEPLARLRIESAMLVAEKLKLIPDWPGGAGVGIGRDAGAGSTRRQGPRTSQLREGDEAWADFDLHGNAVLDGFARLTGTAISTKESYSGPLDISIEARTDNNIRVFASAHVGLIFNYREADHNELRGWTPSRFFQAAAALKPNTWYRLRWKITEKSFQVFVEDQLMFEERGEYDFRPSNPVWIQGGISGSTVDVKSFTVTPLTKTDE